MIDMMRARLAGVKTWVWEQVVLLALILLATGMQICGRLPHVDGVFVGMLIMQGWAVMLGQKGRSIADRQAEKNRAHGVENVEIECVRAQRNVGIDAQAIGLIVGVLTAATWTHILIAAYIVLYPFWRAFYRQIKPLRRQTEQVQRAPDQEMRLRELFTSHPWLVVHTPPQFNVDAAIQARIADDLRRSPANEILVVRSASIVARRNIDAASVTCTVRYVQHGGNVLGAGIDRAYVVYTSRDPVDVVWLKSVVFGQVRALGRVVVFWDRDDAVPHELRAVGHYADLRPAPPN